MALKFMRFLKNDGVATNAALAPTSAIFWVKARVSLVP